MSTLRKRRRVKEVMEQTKETKFHQNQNGPELIVFGELLQEILENVSTYDLIQCRKVNKHWWTTSQKKLLQRSDHLLTFKYNPPQCNYVPSRRVGIDKYDYTTKMVKNCKSLESFNQLMMSPHYQLRPLCINFCLLGGNLDCKDAQEFFTHFGPSIKKLVLDMWCYDQPSDDAKHVTSLEAFGRLLETKVPNLSSLAIQSYPTAWWGIRWTPEEFLATNGGLPQIQFLEVAPVASVDNPILCKIMAAAVNLKATKFVQLDIPSTSLNNVALHTSSKSHRVQTQIVNIRCLPELAREIEAVETFAGYKINLEQLHFALSYGSVTGPNNYGYGYGDDEGEPVVEEFDFAKAQQKARGEDALLKIFVNSKNSLKIARFGPTAFALLNKLGALGDLPSFPNVRNLSLDGNHGPSEKQPVVTQWSFKVSDLFPQVEEMRIDIHEFWLISTYCPPFSLDDQLMRVKKLTMYCNAPSGKFPKNLHLLLPEVEVMNLMVVRNFAQIAKHIWLFSKLKRLQFNLNLNANFFPHFDAAFTGLNVNHVKRLYNDPTFNFRDKDLDSLRERPSILDLKELELLEMSFEEWKLKLRSSYNFMTRVTGHYAFRLMPTLKIILSLDEWAIRNPRNIPTLKFSLLPITSLDNVSIKQDEEKVDD